MDLDRPPMIRGVCALLAAMGDEPGKLDEDRQQIQGLIFLNDSAELHSLLGELEEKVRNHLSSAAQHEQAARMEPSGQDILNWGAELLLHQTFAPAIEVFFPESARLHNGLGIVFYGAGQTDGRRAHNPARTAAVSG